VVPANEIRKHSNRPVLQDKASEVAMIKLQRDHLTNSKMPCHVCGKNGIVNEDTGTNLPHLLQRYVKMKRDSPTTCFPPKPSASKKNHTTGGWGGLAVLLCCNFDGSEKLKPLVIGKYAKSQCFTNTSS
jgi:hypothetical protein